jgi:hypothetical protein
VQPSHGVHIPGERLITRLSSLSIPEVEPSLLHGDAQQNNFITTEITFTHLPAFELEEGVLVGRHWKYRYSTVYEINETDADEFDTRFVKKEKGYQYTQEIFSIAFRSYVR